MRNLICFLILNLLMSSVSSSEEVASSMSSKEFASEIKVKRPKAYYKKMIACFVASMEHSFGHVANGRETRAGVNLEKMGSVNVFAKNLNVYTLSENNIYISSAEGHDEIALINTLHFTERNNQHFFGDETKNIKGLSDKDKKAYYSKYIRLDKDGDEKGLESQDFKQWDHLKNKAHLVTIEEVDAVESADDLNEGYSAILQEVERRFKKTTTAVQATIDERNKMDKKHTSPFLRRIEFYFIKNAFCSCDKVIDPQALAEAKSALIDSKIRMQSLSDENKGEKISLADFDCSKSNR